MADSITIGSYEISTDVTASDTDGVTLFPFDHDQPTLSLFRPRVTSGATEISFFAHVNADNVATLKTRVEAVQSAVIAGGDATVKFGSDTVYQVQLAGGGFQSSEGETEVEYGELDALVFCRMRYLKFQPSGGAGGGGASVENPEGLTGSVQFAVGRSPAGKLRVVASAIFKDEEDSTARENALAWVRYFYTPQSLPDFLPASDRLRRVDDTVTVEQADEDVTIAGQAAASVTLEDIGSELASVNALIARASVAVNVETPELDVRGGLAPRFIAVSGNFEIKTDGSSTWDSSDSVPTVTLAILKTAVNSIYDAALARLELTRGEVQQLSGTLASTEEGSVSFQIRGVTADTRFVVWDESLAVNATSNVTYTGNYGGGETSHLAGSEGDATITHSLVCEAINSGVSYQKPLEVAGSSYRLISAADSKPKTRQARSFVGAEGADATITRGSWTRVYKYENRGSNRTAGGGLESVISQVLGG